MSRRIEVIDTTLRDGEQAAGIAFSIQEKLDIAVGLVKAGVRWIEAGTPAMGAEERDAMRQIVNAGLAASVFSWNRSCREDILASVACGFTNVHISIPVSDLHIQYKLKKDRAWALAQLAATVKTAQSFGCAVSVGAEDASRATPVQFLEVAELAGRLGAVRIRYADTIGCLEPFRVYELMSYLTPRAPLAIEFHAHNDFGMAVANSLAACSGGTAFVSTTVGGIGERAGNAAMEEVVAAAHSVCRWETGIDLLQCLQLGEMVAKASVRPVFPFKPVTGNAIGSKKLPNWQIDCQSGNPRIKV
jgi:homocitrate synthase NifV